MTMTYSTTLDEVLALRSENAELKSQIERSRAYATNHLVHFVAKHFPPNTEWKPLPDLLGVLTQLDNATCVTDELRSQLGLARDAVKHYERYENEERLVDALAEILALPDDLEKPASFCSRCGGSDPDCYICGKSALTSAQREGK